MQLVFLPGLACDARMWAGISEALSPNAAIAISTAHSRFNGIETMAAAVLDENPGDLLLCGASMGGIIAMEAARQAPQRVHGLALLGTNARPETEDMRRLREGAIQLFAAGRADEVLSSTCRWPSTRPMLATPR
jgi:pimeloyl-ACP methyl ester carboxylesterase